MRHLRYFVAAAEHLSFSQAAKVLGIAQPPLSIQIRKLEEELGTPLFLRAGRKIALTPAGQTFLKDAKLILSQADISRQRIQDEAHGRAGSIRLCHTEMAHSSLITKKLRKFVRKHPGVNLLLEALSEETFDPLGGRMRPFSRVPAGHSSGDWRSMSGSPPQASPCRPPQSGMGRPHWRNALVSPGPHGP